MDYPGVKDVVMEPFGQVSSPDGRAPVMEAAGPGLSANGWYQVFRSCSDPAMGGFHARDFQDNPAWVQDAWCRFAEKANAMLEIQAEREAGLRALLGKCEAAMGPEAFYEAIGEGRH